MTILGTHWRTGQGAGGFLEVATWVQAGSDIDFATQSSHPAGHEDNDAVAQRCAWHRR